jgi:hypothetical protein
VLGLHPSLEGCANFPYLWDVPSSRTSKDWRSNSPRRPGLTGRQRCVEFNPRFRGGPSLEEIDTAAADLNCQSRSALVAIWSTVESAYQQWAIEERPDVLAQLRNWEMSRLRMAQAVLAETEPS